MPQLVLHQFTRYFLLSTLLVLTACDDQPRQATDEAEAVTKRQSSAEIPEKFVGVWARNNDACNARYWTSRYFIKPNRYQWQGGSGDVMSVESSDDQIDVTLAYFQEGSPINDAQPHTLEMTLTDEDALTIVEPGLTTELVRCEKRSLSEIDSRE